MQKNGNIENDNYIFESQRIKKKYEVDSKKRVINPNYNTKITSHSKDIYEWHSKENIKQYNQEKKQTSLYKNYLIENETILDGNNLKNKINLNADYKNKFFDTNIHKNKNTNFKTTNNEFMNNKILKNFNNDNLTQKQLTCLVGEQIK